MEDYVFYRDNDLLDIADLKANIISESENYLPMLNGALTKQGEKIKQKDLQQAKIYIDEYLNDLNNFSSKNNILYYNGTTVPDNDLPHRIANLIMQRAIISSNKKSIAEDTRLKGTDADLFRKLHSQYLFGHLKNPSKSDLKDFIYLDYDPTTKTVTNNNNRIIRAKNFKDWVNNNYFTYVNGSDEDKNNFLSKVDQWLLFFNDGINENEYLDLKNLTGVTGEEWNALYMPKLELTKPLTPQEQFNQHLLNFQNNLISQYDPSISSDWIYNLNIPDNSGDYSKKALRNELNRPEVTSNILLKALSNFFNGDKHIVKNLVKEVIEKNNLQNTRYTQEFVINSIIQTLFNNFSDALPSTGIDGLYYLPNIETNNNSLKLVYDNINKQLKLMNVWDIPTWVDSLRDNYFALNQSQTTGIDPRITASIARRGVLSAKTGGVLIPKYKLGSVKTGLGQAFTTAGEARHYLENDLTDLFRILSKYDNDDAFNNSYITRENRVSDNIAPGNDLYDPEFGGKHLLELQWYQNWVNDVLLKDENVAKAWVQRYILLNPLTSHANSWFIKDENGNSVFDMNTFVNSKTKNGKHIALDEINGPGHDFYRGRAYQVVDENGNVIDTNFYNDYGDDYELVEGDPTIDNDNLTKVYKIRKKENTKTPSENTKTLSDKTVITNKDGKWYNSNGEEVDENGNLIKKPLLNLNLSPNIFFKEKHYPNHWLMDLALLATRSIGNRKARTDLLVTAHSPDPINMSKKTVGDLPTQMVTGNYAYNVTSDVRNNMMTADAERNAAIQLQAYTKNVLPALIQGNLYNNNMMRTTGEQAWNVKKDVLINHNQVSNKAKEIANTVDEKNREINADYHRSEADNLANFFKHISYDWQKREAEAKEHNLKINLTVANTWYQNALKSANDAFEKWKKDNDKPNAIISDWDNYSNYQTYLNNLYNLLTVLSNGLIKDNSIKNNIYSYDWKSHLTGNLPKLSTFKRGGKLISKNRNKYGNI